MDHGLPINEIWTRTFNEVQRSVDIPTVWLAMQAVHPIVIDGGRFVATIPKDLRYLAINLEGADIVHAIESVMEDVAGRPLAFLIIDGQTVEEWEEEKEALGGGYTYARSDGESEHSAEVAEWLHIPQSVVPRPERESFADPPVHRPDVYVPSPPASSLRQTPHAASIGSAGFESWDKLYEHLNLRFRGYPMVRYPHGQARFLIESARDVSDTMDRLMPIGGPQDPNHERLLAKTIERLGSLLNLDPLFVSLQIMSYRQLMGKHLG